MDSRPFLQGWPTPLPPSDCREQLSLCVGWKACPLALPPWTDRLGGMTVAHACHHLTHQMEAYWLSPRVQLLVFSVLFPTEAPPLDLGLVHGRHSQSPGYGSGRAPHEIQAQRCSEPASSPAGSLSLRGHRPALQCGAGLRGASRMDETKG